MSGPGRACGGCLEGGPGGLKNGIGLPALENLGSFSWFQWGSAGIQVKGVVVFVFPLQPAPLAARSLLVGVSMCSSGPIVTEPHMCHDHEQSFWLGLAGMSINSFVGQVLQQLLFKGFLLDENMTHARSFDHVLTWVGGPITLCNYMIICAMVEAPCCLR